MAPAPLIDVDENNNSAVVYQQVNRDGCSYIVVISSPHGTSHISLLGDCIQIDDRGIPLTDKNKRKMNQAALELERVVDQYRINPRELKFSGSNPLKDWYCVSSNIEHKLDDVTHTHPGSPSIH